MKHALGRHLPSIINLVAFTTVARTGSVTRAAQELFLTQSAVSRQIKALEDFVGQPLFSREQGEMTLTPKGRLYAEKVEGLLTQIEEATLEITTSSQASTHITISCQATLATKWLLPNMVPFSKAHPDVFVNVETHLGQLDLRRTAADAVLIFRQASELGWTMDRLFSGGGYPVCTPALLQTTTKRGIDALAVLPLLHQRSTTGGWREYFNSLGQPQMRVRPGPVYALLSMGLQATLAGLGVALLPDFVVKEDLEAGRLVQVHDVPFIKAGSYSLMLREPSRGTEVIELLRDWLLEAASQT